MPNSPDHSAPAHSTPDPTAPDHTALRTALWRALHVELDPPPHVLADPIGAKLIGDPDWRQRPDMQPDFSKPMRASIVGRARLVEDLVLTNLERGVSQYVILGAGLDTFAQRHPEISNRLRVFEIDQPGTQAWKRARLSAAGYETGSSLRFVPFDFERSGQYASHANAAWWDTLCENGFDPAQPAVVASTGVSMYLSKETNGVALRQLARLAPGSTLAMTFMLSLEQLEGDERAIMEYVMNRAAESGTPFLSLFAPDEIVGLAERSGFKSSETILADEIYRRYFAQRSDGLRAGNAEAFLIART